MNNNTNPALPRTPFPQRHPIIFGLIIIMVFFAVMNIAAIAIYIIQGIILSFISLDSAIGRIISDEWVIQGLAETVTLIFGLVMIKVSGCWDCLKERGRGVKTGIACAGYFIFASVLAGISNAALLLQDKPPISPPWRIAAYLITFILVGLTEEFYFRGALANIFYKKHASTPAGVWTATIYSGLIFGLMHLMNGLGVIIAPNMKTAAATLVGPLVQTVSAVAMGILLTAVYFRCRNIWVMAGVHAFIDICAGLYSGLAANESLNSTIEGYTPGPILFIAPYIIATAVLLRPSKIREILDYRSGIDVCSYEYKLMQKGFLLPGTSLTPQYPGMPGVYPAGQQPIQYGQPLPNPQDGQPAQAAPTYTAPGQSVPDAATGMTAAPENTWYADNPQQVSRDVTETDKDTQSCGFASQPQSVVYPQNGMGGWQPVGYLSRYTSDKMAKKSLVKSIVTAVCIILTLNIMSYALYAYANDTSISGFLLGSDEVFSYEYTGSPKVMDDPCFSDSTGYFTVPKDGSYRITIMSLPDNSKAYMEISVFESGSAAPIYRETYGGRCSDNVELELRADKEYSIYMDYDFSDALDSMSYTTKIKVSLDE